MPDEEYNFFSNPTLSLFQEAEKMSGTEMDEARISLQTSKKRRTKAMRQDEMRGHKKGQGENLH